LSAIGILTTILSYKYFKRKFKKTIKFSVAPLYS
jgi:hypothetical protein